MKKANLVIVLALFALAAVIWGKHLTNWMRPVPNLTRYPLGPRFLCESCGWHFDESPRFLPPIKCPKCKKETAMKTFFSPSAAAPEFIQCRKCQAQVPYLLFKWVPDEKARWEKRLQQLGEGEFLTSDEMNELQKGKLVKSSASDWMKWDDFVASDKTTAVRCTKCGNADPAQFDYQPRPPGAQAGH